ncbi:Protein kinase-like domain [Trinorchestia longiramus]|nr:Protein kinase-like domain [Trinorchestia longiramus]
MFHDGSFGSQLLFSQIKCMNMAGGKRKRAAGTTKAKVEPESQSNTRLGEVLPQSRQYGRKNKKPIEEQGCRKTKARPPPPPFTELFIGAKENNPDLFDIFSNEKEQQQQTLPPACRSPLAPLAVSGLHSYSNSLPSINNDTFDRIFSKNSNTAVVSHAVAAVASSVVSDSSSQSNLASLNLPGPLYASLADCKDLYDTLEKTLSPKPFQHQLCSAATTKAERKNYEPLDNESNFLPSEVKETDCGRSNPADGTNNKQECTNLETLSPAQKSLIFTFKTPDVRTRCRRRQRPLLTQRSTPTLVGNRLAGKLATMRCRRRQDVESRASKRENKDSITLSFTVERDKQNDDRGEHNGSLIGSNASYLENERDSIIVEPPLHERLSGAEDKLGSPVTSNERVMFARHRSLSSRLQRSRDVVGERLTSTPSHHYSSRARLHGLQGSVTPLVGRLYSHVEKLSPVLREDCSQDSVFVSSTVFETPLSKELDDVFKNDQTSSSRARKVNELGAPVLKLDGTPLSTASDDIDFYRKSNFSQHNDFEIGPPCDNTQNITSGIVKSLKVVVSPLKNIERYSSNNSEALNASERSETISLVIQSRRRRNPSIKIHTNVPPKSATTCNTDRSSENGPDGKLIVGQPKFNEQDLVMSSFFYEAIRCSVVPSPVLTRRQRKARQSRIPSLDSDVSQVQVKKCRRRNLRSLIPAELLLKPTSLQGAYSEEDNVKDDNVIKNDMVSTIDDATNKDSMTNDNHKTQDDRATKHRLYSETSCEDVDLSISDNNGKEASEAGGCLSQSEKDKTGQDVTMNPTGFGSIHEQQLSSSGSCDKSLTSSKKSSPLSYSDTERTGGEAEVSTVADLAAPIIHHVPTKRGKGWRRSLSAQARLSTCAVRASSVGESRRATTSLGPSVSNSGTHVDRVDQSALVCSWESEYVCGCLHGCPPEQIKMPNVVDWYHQLGRLVSESACEQEDPGSNPAADMVDAARNTAWDLGIQPNNYRSNYPTQEWARRLSAGSERPPPALTEVPVSSSEEEGWQNEKEKTTEEVGHRKGKDVAAGEKENEEGPIIEKEEESAIEEEEVEEESAVEEEEFAIEKEEKEESAIQKKEEESAIQKEEEESAIQKEEEESAIEKEEEEPAVEKKEEKVIKKEKAVNDDAGKEEAKQRILQLCGQQDILQLTECFSESQLGNCKKIGEGAYGEVFLSEIEGEKKVFKFMPIEGDLKINDEVQKTFAEIYSEIIISMKLSGLRDEGREGGCCGSYVHVLRCWCVRGAYTDHLLHLWDAFHAQKESENDRPDVYRSDQLHIVLEFAHAGQDLECFVFTDACQAHALFWQVTIGLAVAEEALEFEHRDLHFGNVLVAATDDLSCVYTLEGEQIILPTQGVRATIIDFTMSRLRCADSGVVYTDLSKEPEIFTGSGDYQFDIYRLMRDVLQDDWEKFNPRTNVLWLHYLADKLISACYFKTKTTSQHRTYISKLQKLKDSILRYESARHLVSTYDDDDKF